MGLPRNCATIATRRCLVCLPRRSVLVSSRRWCTRRLRICRASYGQDAFESEFDRMFESAARAQRQAFDRMLSESQELVERQSMGNNVRIEKSEQRTDDGYSYYESVTITQSGPWTTARPMSTSFFPFGGSLWSFIALMLGAIYAFLTYRFNR